jgi:hypothetical protein
MAPTPASVDPFIVLSYAIVRMTFPVFCSLST